MADEYELQRPQLSEDQYLAGYRAIGDAQPGRQWRPLRHAHAEEAGDGCPSCERLRRQRKAAAEQVDSLSKSVGFLEEEADSLRSQVASLQHGIRLALSAWTASPADIAADSGADAPAGRSLAEDRVSAAVDAVEMLQSLLQGATPALSAARAVPAAAPVPVPAPRAVATHAAPAMASAAAVVGASSAVADSLTTTTGSSSAGPNTAGSVNSLPRAAAMTQDDDDVLIEGDGRVPCLVTADARPHRQANIVCCAVLPGPEIQGFNGVGNSLGRNATGGQTHPRRPLVVATGGADKRVVLTVLDYSCSSGDDAGQGGAGGIVPKMASAAPLAALALTAPVLALAVRPWDGSHEGIPSSGSATGTAAGAGGTMSRSTGILAASCMDGTVHLLRYTLGYETDGAGPGSAGAAGNTASIVEDGRSWRLTATLAHCTMHGGVAASPAAIPTAVSAAAGSASIAASGATTGLMAVPAILRAHSKYVTRLAWSADGRVLASGSSDRSLCLWEVTQATWAGDAGEATPAVAEVADVAHTFNADAEHGEPAATESPVDDWGPSPLLAREQQYAAAASIGRAASTDATSSGDRNNGPPDVLAVTKLQQLHLSKGSVEALAWCREEDAEVAVPVSVESAAPGSSVGTTTATAAGTSTTARLTVDTLAFSVRGSAALYYLRLLRGTSVAVTGAQSGAYAEAAQTAVQAYTTVLACCADGQMLPSLGAAGAFGPATALSSSRGPLSTSATALALHRIPVSEDGSAMDVSWCGLAARGLHGLAHEVMVAGVAGTATATGLRSRSLLGPAPPAPRADLTTEGTGTAAGVGSARQSLTALQRLTAQQRVDAQEAEEDEGELDARAVQAALTNPATVRSMGLAGPGPASVSSSGAAATSATVTSAAGIAFGSGYEPSLSGTAAEAARARKDQETAASSFIPVGFSLVDLVASCSTALVSTTLGGTTNAAAAAAGGGDVRSGAGAAAHLITAGRFSPSAYRRPLLATAADNGVVYLQHWGSNAVIRRLVGHKTGGLTDSPTRLAWVPPGRLAGTVGHVAVQHSPQHQQHQQHQQPYYLAATSSTDNAIVLYSVGSGAAVARLAVVDGTRGAHTGAVRDLCPVQPPEQYQYDNGADVQAPAWPLLLSAGFDKRLLAWSPAL